MDIRVSKVLDNIKAIREEKDLSIMDLANEANMARSYIFYIESKKKVPTLTSLFKLADALGVDIKDFFK